jgi:hypothetical protein
MVNTGDLFGSNIYKAYKDYLKEVGPYPVGYKELLKLMGNCVRNKRLDFVKVNFKVGSLNRE